MYACMYTCILVYKFSMISRDWERLEKRKWHHVVWLWIIHCWSMFYKSEVSSERVAPCFQISWAWHHGLSGCRHSCTWSGLRFLASKTQRDFKRIGAASLVYSHSRESDGTINPRPCRGSVRPPPWLFFWNGFGTDGQIAQTKKMTGSGQVTELWRHKWYNLRRTFEGNRVFSNVTCCH